jgi:dipeptidyl aminopeptidase/acylaminoacyl peptidase
MKLRKIILQAGWFLAFGSALGCILAAPAFAQDEQKNRMTPELLWKLGRLGEAVTSPDGSQIAYTVRRYELEKDKGNSNLHVINVADLKDAIVLKAWNSIGSLDWIATKDGDRLFFEGTQAPAEEAEGDDDGPSNQAWSVDVKSGNTTQLTSIDDGIANFKVAPGGTKLAFTLDVKLDQEPNEIYPDLPKANARIIDQLMFRHWNAWHDYKYSHLHVAVIGDNGVAGEAIDLMKGIKADCPVPPFGGTEQFNWSPDASEIAFTLKDVDKWEESTNSDVFLIAADGSSPARNVSENGEGYDNNPTYSPDGKYIAYSSMQRAGFESDRNRIILIDRSTGGSKELTVGLDQNANGPIWMSDSKALVFDSERGGTNQLFKIEVENGSTSPISKGRFNWHAFGNLGSGKLLVSRTDMLRPAELYSFSLADSSDARLTGLNDDIYANLELPTIEERYVEATDGKKIHCWVIHPPDFDPKADKKWPLLTYCQGGPQGQIGQWFSYRWNFHLMAANGYIVVAPNRRGLPGFGRQWNDQISGDWGGQAMKDILSATDSMTAEEYVDNDRVGAIGASFGGYTVYWLMGNHRDRFCAMIAHCGVFNLESMYGSTEELFFVNWDLGGPYWKSDEIMAKYQQFSPHRFIQKWTTPLLVIHGQRDFRVPVTQGMEAFTAAQVQDVPSRFLYFPEEGHWVMKPQNGVLWHRVFFDWLDRFCKNPTSGNATTATGN